jgi:hypothetical protein
MMDPGFTRGVVTMANYGIIVEDTNRRWHFVFDPQLRLALSQRGISLPSAVLVKPTWCNPTPPFAPTVGGFTHPHTGHYCHPKCLERYNASIHQALREPALGRLCEQLYRKQQAWRAHDSFQF